MLETAVIAEDNVPQALEFEDVEKQNVFFSYPIDKGIIQDIDGLEAIITQILYHQSGWRYGDEGHVVMVEPVLNSRLTREMLTQLMFEEFNVSSYFVTDAATASLYSVGKSSGIVVNVGYEKIDVVPVLEGCMHPSVATRIPVGGKHMTDILQDVLRKTHGIELEFEDVEKMKIDVCKKAAGDSVSSEETYLYKLPDGQTVNLAKSMEEVTQKILSPRLLAVEAPDISEACIHAGIVTTVHGERESRKALMDAIFVCGGGSGIPNLSESILKGIASSSHASLPPSLCSVPDYMPPQTKAEASWFGGAIIGNCMSQANAQMGQQSVTKAEYNEYGPNVIHKHCC